MLAELLKKEQKEKAKKDAISLPLTGSAPAPAEIARAPASALEMLTDRILNAVRAPFSRGTPRMTEEQKSLARGILQKMNSRELAVAWNTWHSHAEEAAYILGRINRAVRLLRDPSFARAWAKWAEFYQERLHAKELLRKTLARMTHGTVVAAIGTWHDFAQCETHFSHQERLLRLSIARMRRPWLVEALRAWQQECGIASRTNPCHALARCMRFNG